MNVYQQFFQGFVNIFLELRLQGVPLELPMLHFLAMLSLLKGCTLIQKKFKLSLHFLRPLLLNKLYLSLDLQDTIDTLYLILPPCPTPLFNLPKKDVSFHGVINSRNHFCCSKVTFALLLFKHTLGLIGHSPYKLMLQM